MDAGARVALLSRMLTLMLLFAPAVAIARGESGVGFQTIVLHDPVNGGTTPGYVFYPSSDLMNCMPHRTHLQSPVPNRCW